MTNSLLLAIVLMAVAPFGATLLLARRAPTGGADFVTALLRLAQALPLPIGVLYGIGAWWSGPVSIALGLGAGLLAAPILGSAAFPLGVFALMAGLSYLGSIVLRTGGLP